VIKRRSMNTINQVKLRRKSQYIEIGQNFLASPQTSKLKKLDLSLKRKVFSGSRKCNSILPDTSFEAPPLLENKANHRSLDIIDDEKESSTNTTSKSSKKQKKSRKLKLKKKDKFNTIDSDQPGNILLPNLTKEERSKYYQYTFCLVRY